MTPKLWIGHVVGRIIKFMKFDHYLFFHVKINVTLNRYVKYSIKVTNSYEGNNLELPNVGWVS